MIDIDKNSNHYRNKQGYDSLVSKVDKDLREYINENVFPKYKRLDEGHDIEHIKDVIYISLLLATKTSKHINHDIVYAGAAYHDIGMTYYPNDLKKSRDKHHIYSSKIVLNKEKKNLKEFFTDEEINLIAKIVKDHRASHDGIIDNVYSKVVADADNVSSLHIEEMIRRSYNYNLNHNPDDKDQERYENVYNHLKDKYGTKGYAIDSLQLNETLLLFKDEIEKSGEILKNEDKFIKVYRSLYEDNVQKINKTIKESLNGFLN